MTENGAGGIGFLPPLICLSHSLTLSPSYSVQEGHIMIPDLQRSIDELQRKLDQLRVYL